MPQPETPEVTTKEVASRMAMLIDLVEQLRMHLSEQIHESIDNDMIYWTKEMLDCSEQLKLLSKEKLPRIEKFLDHVVAEHLNCEVDRGERLASGLRTLEILVSQGMLNQSLLTLTDARKGGLVNIGEEFNVTIPNGGSFQTTLADPGNRLKERAMIRAFYESEGVKAEDAVYLVESSQGNWNLVTGGSKEGKEAHKTINAGIQKIGAKYNI